MTVTTNERGQQNVFAKEPTMTFDERYTVSHNEKAEMLNGRLAMVAVLGFVAYEAMMAEPVVHTIPF